jgi:uncharacterized membrane protein YkvI
MTACHPCACEDPGGHAMRRSDPRRKEHGFALGLGALAIHLALLAGMPEAGRFEVPMLHLAGRLPAWVGMLYSLVLWAEIYTTAVSCLFGLAVRFAPEGNPARYRWLTLALGAGALLFGQLGFARMVAVVFPVTGWLGLLYIAGIGLRLLRRVRTPVG